MTRLAVTFPDAMLVTLPILRGAPALDGVTFGTRLPEDFDADEAPSIPYGVVRLDATSTRYPVTETATLRVSIWGATEHEGLVLAQKARAVLLSYSGGADVRGFGEGVGPTPTTDPESGSPLSSFTVAARLRPSPM